MLMVVRDSIFCHQRIHASLSLRDAGYQSRPRFRLIIWALGQERQAASAGTYAEIDNARPFVSKCHKVRLLY